MLDLESVVVTPTMENIDYFDSGVASSSPRMCKPDDDDCQPESSKGRESFTSNSSPGEKVYGQCTTKKGRKFVITSASRTRAVEQRKSRTVVRIYFTLVCTYAFAVSRVFRSSV